MTRREIVDRLARAHYVESVVANILHRPPGRFPEDADLSQMVYLWLLDYDAARVEEMYEAGQLPFFVVRLVLNNARSTKSRWYYLFRKFVQSCTGLQAPEPTDA